MTNTKALFAFDLLVGDASEGRVSGGALVDVAYAAGAVVEVQAGEETKPLEGATVVSGDERLLITRDAVDTEGRLTLRVDQGRSFVEVRWRGRTPKGELSADLWITFDVPLGKPSGAVGDGQGALTALGCRSYLGRAGSHSENGTKRRRVDVYAWPDPGAKR